MGSLEENSMTNLFMLKWVTYIDMYALLTTTGTGSFSKTVIEQDMLPAPESALKNTNLNMVFIPEAFRQMPQLLRINRELTLMALRMAQAARQLRSDARDLSVPPIEKNIRQCNAMRDIYTLLISFEHTWHSHLEITDPEEDWLEEMLKLPGGPFTCRTHVSSYGVNTS